MRLLWLVTLFAGCFVHPIGFAAAQDLRPSKALISAIDRVVADQGIDASTPGIAILIHQPNSLVFSKGYGLANLKTKAPIDSSTLFELASCSKPFTAMATLLLHDRKLLSLDDDIRKLLPELPVYHRDSPITIRDLLRHTSGIPEYFDFEEVPTKNKSFAVNADYLPMFARLKRDFPQEFKAGTKHSYCNSNYLLLALIVERASGKEFPDFIKMEFLTPLGMNDTFLYSSPKAVPATSQSRVVRAIGYEKRRGNKDWKASWGTPPDRTEKECIVGDGGVWTNLDDMLKWDAAIRSRKFLLPETWKQALEVSKTTNGKTIDYGLGWMLEREGSRKIVGFGHNGYWSGFSTCYWHSTTSHRTMVLLSNRSDADTDEIWSAIEECCENQKRSPSR